MMTALSCKNTTSKPTCDHGVIEINEIQEISENNQSNGHAQTDDNMALPCSIKST